MHPLAKQPHFIPARLYLALAAVFYSAYLSAAQLDLLPDDYLIQTKTASLTVSYLHREQLGAYVHGSLNSPSILGVKLPATEIESNIVSVRLSQVFELNGLTVAPVIVSSYRDIQNQSDIIHPTINTQNILGKGAEGVRGDLGLGGSLWLINDKVNKEFLAVTAFLTLPTGDYNAKTNINLGENRWRFVLGSGWLKPIGDHWVSELSPEIAWYGDNDAFRDYTKLKYFNPLQPNNKLAGQETLSQSTSYALSETLRYKITPQLQVFVMGQINRGGKTGVNGQLFAQAPNNDRAAIGAIFYTEAGNQWLLRYMQDVSIDNGLKLNNELTLRYMYYF